MIPGTPISSQPRGLLGLLGIKTGGSYPGKLVDSYQPTIDLLDWMIENLSQELITASSVGAAAAGSYNSATFFPQGNECWAVRSFEAYVNTTAAEAIRMRPVLLCSGPSAGVRQIGPECASSLTDAAAAAFVRVLSDRPFILLPNMGMGTDVTRITSAGLTINYRAMIYRFTA